MFGDNPTPWPARLARFFFPRTELSPPAHPSALQGILTIQQAQNYAVSKVWFCKYRASVNFCPNCGAPVSSAPPPPRPTAPPPPPRPPVGQNPSLAGMKLVCPKCVVQNTYRFDGVQPMYSFVCSSCKVQFQSRIVTVRHKNSRLHQRSHVRRHFSVTGLAIRLTRRN